LKKATSNKTSNNSQPAQQSEPQQVHNPSNNNSMSSNDILGVMNLARTQPKQYAKYLDNALAKFTDNYTYRDSNGMSIRSNEGKSAVVEARSFMQGHKGVHPLKFAAQLCNAAQDHAEYCAKKK